MFLGEAHRKLLGETVDRSLDLAQVVGVPFERSVGRSRSGSLVGLLRFRRGLPAGEPIELLAEPAELLSNRRGKGAQLSDPGHAHARQHRLGLGADPGDGPYRQRGQEFGGALRATTRIPPGLASSVAILATILELATPTEQGRCSVERSSAWTLSARARASDASTASAYIAASSMLRAETRSNRCARNARTSFAVLPYFSKSGATQIASGQS